MVNKQEIIDEIKKVTKLNDGKPLDTEKFAKETGISLHHCQKYWSIFSKILTK
jgi:hypothetical protein